MLEKSVIAGLAALLIIVIAWSYTDTEAKPKPVVIHKLTANSKSNSVAAVINTHFKLPNRKPTIVWQDPKTGDALTESFIKKQYPTKALQNAAFKTLRQQGIRRVFEVCRGLSEPTNRWSFGYCTYEDAPQQLEG